MNLSFFILIGMITVSLSALFIIENNQNSNFDVFAQSDNNTSQEKNFESASESHSSNTSSNIGNKKKSKESFLGRPSPNENSKIHPAILQVLENANPKSAAKIFGASIDDNKIYVYIHLADKEIQKKPLGIEVLAQDQNIIVSKLSLNQIKSLANSDAVKRISLPDTAVLYDHIESEGVSFSIADEMHTAGFNGTGIKVAVIDTSFFPTHHEIVNNVENATLFDSQNNCSGNITCGQVAGNSHGTAVAEIIVDMAPDVKLLLYTIYNHVDFNNAVDDAVNSGANIITASLGFSGQGGDGTDPNKWYRDGTSSVAKKVNEATNNGILFTVAAGNQGLTHWSGTYMKNTTAMGEPLNGDMETILSGSEKYQSVMIFNSTAPDGDPMQACLPVNVKASVNPLVMSWNAWPETNTEDYDIFLYNYTMVEFLNYGSAIPQNPSNTEPLEFFFPPTLGDACLVVFEYSSTKDNFLHLDLSGSSFRDSSYLVKSGSIDTPADASGALSVGAVDFDNTPTSYSDDFLEPFSSQGPTDDGRVKPEICGPDGTSSSQFGGIFTGTSGATPHVAGALALLIEENRTKGLNLNSTEIQQKLISDARFNATYSVDNLCGSGSLELNLTPSSTITVTKTANGGNEIFDFATTVDDENLDGNFTGNGGFSLNTSIEDTIKFTGLSPDLNYTITESPESGWKFNSVSCGGNANSPLISGSTVTIDPNPDEEINCTFTNTKIISCTPPDSGPWNIIESCTLNTNHSIVNGSVTVQNNSVLTIPDGITLDIDFLNHNLTVKFGSGILIKSGGTIS